MIGCAIILGLAFSFIVLGTQDIRATTPSSVDLAYDIGTQTLSVTISHPVADPNTHYIKTVEIKKNSQSLIVYNYTSQPTTSSFTYTYSVEALAGDVIEATATCSIIGSKSGSGTASTSLQDLPPTITITTPANSTTIYAAQTTVSGTATGNLTNGKVELKVNDGQWLEAIGTDSWGLQIDLNEGSNTVIARVTDSKGNSARAQIIINSDTIIPTPPAKPKKSPGFESILVLFGVLSLAALIKIKRS